MIGHKKHQRPVLIEPDTDSPKGQKRSRVDESIVDVAIVFSLATMKRSKDQETKHLELSYPSTNQNHSLLHNAMTAPPSLTSHLIPESTRQKTTKDAQPKSLPPGRPLFPPPHLPNLRLGQCIKRRQTQSVRALAGQ